MTASGCQISPRKEHDCCSRCRCRKRQCSLGEQSLARSFGVRSSGGTVCAAHDNHVGLQPLNSVRKGQTQVRHPLGEISALRNKGKLLDERGLTPATAQHGNRNGGTSVPTDLLHHHGSTDHQSHRSSLVHMALPSGHMFANRYEVMSFIDSGTYGDVYEAIDTHQDDRVVALKLLNPSKMGSWPWQEATMLTRLDSEYVLTIYNADVDAGIPFIATELATRGSLEGAGQLPRLSVPETIAAVRAAARGLARTHDGGIVHRDVKPANLFWSASGSVTVGDFGFAHPLDRNGEAPAEGTPVTAAPELLVGGPSTVLSDVWSLGATAYHLLTGVYPHEDLAQTKSRADLDAARAAGPPTPVRDLAPHVSQRIASRVERALAERPNDRYPSMTSFESDLGAGATPSRSWQECAPDTGHRRCWVSDEPTGLRVCVTPGTTASRVNIEVRHTGSGNRIRSECSDDGYERTAAGRLRAVFERLGN